MAQKTKSLRWPDGRYTAWRDATNESVFHASAPGLYGKARCGAVVDLPLAMPALNCAEMGVVIPFSMAAVKIPSYPGDPCPRIPCEACVREALKGGEGT